MTATLRYWAAAKAAAGTAEEQVATGTLQQVLETAAEGHGDTLRNVLTVCSFLVDEHPVGARPHHEVDVPEGALVDVLPPFAGG